jgi:hypothetical protein
MISMRATEIATQTESTDAISAKPIHNADANQTLSMRSSVSRWRADFAAAYGLAARLDGTPRKRRSPTASLAQ